MKLFEPGYFLNGNLRIANVIKYSTITFIDY